MTVRGTREELHHVGAASGTNPARPEMDHARVAA